MAAAPDVTYLLPTHEVIFRLGAATLVGAIIGINRELRHKPAGLRTQALVTLGSATAALVMSELASLAPAYDTSAISRVAQGVLTGVGFLGGGVILRGQREGEVHGLTTAASIWVAATLGLACGVGLWGLALAVTGLTLVVLHVGVWVERWFHRHEPGSAISGEGPRPPPDSPNPPKP